MGLREAFCPVIRPATTLARSEPNPKTHPMRRRMQTQSRAARSTDTIGPTRLPTAIELIGSPESRNTVINTEVNK